MCIRFSQYYQGGVDGGTLDGVAARRGKGLPRFAIISSCGIPRVVEKMSSSLFIGVYHVLTSCRSVKGLEYKVSALDCIFSLSLYPQSALPVTVV